eukprot:6684809-Alexandrium_andersonii.AAC.1
MAALPSEVRSMPDTNPRSMRVTVSEVPRGAGALCSSPAHGSAGATGKRHPVGRHGGQLTPTR